MSLRLRLCLSRAWVLACLIAPLGVMAAEPPQRVVSVGGHVTEIIYALGAESRLVGADSSSIYPEAATKLPTVGYLRQVGVEGVASLQPDMIIASHDIGPPPAVEKLKALGIPLVITAQTDSIDEAARRIREVGNALGLVEQADALASKVQSEADAESQRLNAMPGPRPKVALFLGFGHASPMAAGAETAGDAMIRLAGGDNVFAGVKGFKPVNAEALIAASPDVIVVMRQALTQYGSLDAVLKALKGIEHTPAGQQRRVVVMDVMSVFSFGPRLPQSIKSLGEGMRSNTSVAHKGGV
jgi:iron complex transport system substrate-binding protein